MENSTESSQPEINVEKTSNPKNITKIRRMPVSFFSLWGLPEYMAGPVIIQWKNRLAERKSRFHVKRCGVFHVKRRERISPLPPLSGALSATETPSASSSSASQRSPFTVT